MWLNPCRCHETSAYEGLLIALGECSHLKVSEAFLLVLRRKKSNHRIQDIAQLGDFDASAQMQGVAPGHVQFPLAVIPLQLR